MFSYIINHIFLFLRLRQEFGIVKKLEKKQSPPKDIVEHEQNKYTPQNPTNNFNNEKIPMSEAEHIENQFNCLKTSCDCSRCINMNGNYYLI